MRQLYSKEFWVDMTNVFSASRFFALLGGGTIAVLAFVFMRKHGLI